MPKLTFLTRLAAITFSLSALSVSAATFTVINSNDSGPGSLSQALTDANNAAGDDDIRFALAGAGPHVIGLSNPLPTITSNLSIINDAPGDEAVTVRKNDSTVGQFEIFRLNSALNVLVSGLTISNGVGGSQGGGALNNGGSTVTLRNCTLSNNQTFNSGGAITTFGTNSPARLTLINCTVSANVSGVEGGAIRNLAAGTSISEVTLINSTFTGHTSGVIVNERGQSGVAKVTITNCTFANNRGVNTSKASNISNNSGVVEIVNSIFARTNGSVGPNFIAIGAATFTSFGHNLADDAAGGDGTTGPGGFLNAAGDIRNTDPKLSPLADNGGQTMTHALLSTSPAIDTGDDTKAPAQDQRDWVRLGVSDIGSFEFGSPSGPMPTPTPTPTPTPSPTPTPPPPLIVTTTSNSGTGSLRQAIEDANANPGDDTILFALPGAGPHVIGLFTALPALAGNVAIINDQSGAEAVTVKRDNTTPFRIFVTSPGATVSIAGLTLTNADVEDNPPANEGGAIYNDHASLTLRKCVLTANKAVRGGAIYNDGRASGSATLALEDCTFDGNSAIEGGGVLSHGGNGGMATLTATRCIFTNNSRSGLLNQAPNSGRADATVVDSIFSSNSDGAIGSGSDGTAEATLTVQRCNISNNTSNVGAGIAGSRSGSDSVSTVTISDSTISNNTASSPANAWGGGIYNSARLTMTRSTVSGNSAQEGGGIYNTGNATLINCTLSSNSATTGVGSTVRNIIGNSAKLTLLNCTFSNTTGTSLHNEMAPAEATNTIFQRGSGTNIANSFGGTFTSKGHNLGDDAAGGDGETTPGGLLNGPGDIRNTNPQLEPLGSNGGPTQTHALAAGSPAINAGDDATAPPADQRNYSRAGVSDIGAFELGGSPIQGVVGNVSTRLPVGAGDAALIEGFIVDGPAGSSKKIIVRALGPWLKQFGLTDALENPTLEIRGPGNVLLATNNNWGTTEVGGIITGDQSAEIAASGFQPPEDLEAAIIADLEPGHYTAVVRGVGNTEGSGLVDGYDLSANSLAKVVNFSTRGLVQAGDQLMIAGFVVQNAPVKAGIRGIGPSLSSFGVPNPLPDPTLELRDKDGMLVLGNDNWETDPAQKAELESYQLQPGHDLEAALITTLLPGQYTAHLRDKNQTSGIGVVEVYFLQ